MNEELRRSNGDEYSFPTERLPVAGRPREVRVWCRENSIREPNKVAVAYRILELGVEEPISAEPYREALAQLFLNITATLQAET